MPHHTLTCEDAEEALVRILDEDQANGCLVAQLIATPHVLELLLDTWADAIFERALAIHQERMENEVSGLADWLASEPFGDITGRSERTSTERHE